MVESTPSPTSNGRPEPRKIGSVTDLFLAGGDVDELGQRHDGREHDVGLVLVDLAVVVVVLVASGRRRRWRRFRCRGEQWSAGARKGLQESPIKKTPSVVRIQLIQDAPFRERLGKFYVEVAKSL